MNKQELIKEFEEIGIHGLNMFGTVVKGIPTKTAIDLIKQLDEPQPIKVPQFVADWITHSKNIGRSLFGAMSIFEENFEIKKWMQWAENQETFARAWLDGYEVEEEKKYKVVLLNYNDGHLNLVNVRTLGENIIFFTKKTQFDPRSLKLTKAEIISSGFGWVFDCEGVEVEEVE